MTFLENRTIKRKHILLSLGANIGNCINNIRSAINYLNSSANFFDLRVSSFYKTEPVGYKEQPWFVNAATSGFTDLSLHELFNFCQDVEAQIGRIEREKWHAREIDIDILLYDNVHVRSHNFIVPHPEMHLRKFVLAPASEIAGDVIHPGFKLTIRQLLENCLDNSIVMKYEP